MFRRLALALVACLAAAPAFASPECDRVIGQALASYMAAHDVSPDDVSNAGILTGALSTEHLVGLHLAGKEAALRGCDALDYAKEAVAADESVGGRHEEHGLAGERLGPRA